MDSRDQHCLPILHCSSGNAWMQTLEDSIVSGKLVVTMFYAPWSTPSKAVYDVIAKLTAAQNANQVIFCKIDIEESKDITARMVVRMVPTIIFTREGKEVARMKGLVSIGQLEEKIAKLS